MMFLGSALTEILPATILLLVVVIAGGIVILRVRKMIKGNCKNEPPFTLEQLREMHENGELNDEEFERAKAAMLDAAMK